MPLLLLLAIIINVRRRKRIVVKALFSRVAGNKGIDDNRASKENRSNIDDRLHIRKEGKERDVNSIEELSYLTKSEDLTGRRSNRIVY